MKKYLSVVFLILLAGCTALSQKLGLETADTTPQRLAYAYTLLAQVRSNATNLLQTKRIDVQTARTVQEMADVTRLSLDQSKQAYFSQTPNPNLALQSLQMAEGLLIQLQVILKTQQARPQ